MVVLSRTLFVGGVKTTEANLKSFFGQFGTVQTCIVNHDKRHAFLKMTTHQEALAIKQAVSVLPETEFRHMFERVCSFTSLQATNLTFLGKLGCWIRPNTIC